MSNFTNSNCGQILQNWYVVIHEFLKSLISNPMWDLRNSKRAYPRRRPCLTKFYRILFKVGIRWVRSHWMRTLCQICKATRWRLNILKLILAQSGISNLRILNLRVLLFYNLFYSPLFCWILVKTDNIKNRNL